MPRWKSRPSSASASRQVPLARIPKLLLPYKKDRFDLRAPTTEPRVVPDGGPEPIGICKQGHFHAIATPRVSRRPIASHSDAYCWQPTAVPHQAKRPKRPVFTLFFAVLALAPHGDGSKNLRLVVSNPAKKPERAAPKPPKPPEVPLIVRLLALAREWQGMIDRGELRTQAQLAARSGLHPYRVSNILCFGLLRLHPAILAHIAGLEAGTPNAPNERWLSTDRAALAP